MKEFDFIVIAVVIVYIVAKATSVEVAAGMVCTYVAGVMAANIAAYIYCKRHEVR